MTDAAFWIKKHKIRLGTLSMLGGPGGTIEDELDTLRLNIECKTDHPLVSIMQPYDTIMINMFKRYFAPKRQQLAISLQMGDEWVVAHMD